MTEPADIAAGLGEGRARVVALADADGQPASVVVVVWKGAVRAFRNRCPHNGVRLDFIPGEVLSPDGRFLRCGTHGARFRPDTGRCVAGPCRGEHLTPVALVRDDHGRVRPAGPLDPA